MFQFQHPPETPLYPGYVLGGVRGVERAGGAQLPAVDVVVPLGVQAAGPVPGAAGVHAAAVPDVPVGVRQRGRGGGAAAAAAAAAAEAAGGPARLRALRRKSGPAVVAEGTIIAYSLALGTFFIFILRICSEHSQFCV